jgi:hypothetical protein
MEAKGKDTSVLCDLANDGKLGDIKNLAREPDFICSGCGRIAHSGENLCSPVSLDDV